tara:strand:- start:1276 stop:2016 length:741 start_codon:yes stop_codon:yes gene_type:complete
MNKYQILIEYVGTAYVGWQIQKKGNSIQKTIQNVLSNLLKEKVILHGSGRTDAGVHALEQSAHFDCITDIKNLEKFVKSLNFFLNKKNISILKIKRKKSNFHSRFSAKERSYIYLIRNALAPSIINHNREWHVIKKLDIGLMKKGAKKFLGTHDFSTFRASNCYSKDPIKTIKKIEIKKNKNLITIRIKSKSFLRNQVRSMVGSLKYLAEKKWDLKKFENVFKSKKRVNCATPAPSHGLYLEKITY